MMDVNGSDPRSLERSLGPVAPGGYFTAAPQQASASDLNWQPVSSRVGLAEVLRRGWWLMAIGVAAGLGTAYFYYTHATPIYTASAHIMLSDTGPHVADDGQPMASSAFLQSQAELMRSMSVLEHAASASDAKAMRSFRDVRSVPTALRDAITVDPDPKAESMFVVSVDTIDPDEGTRVLNGVIAAYSDELAAVRRTGIESVVKVLARQAADLKTEETVALDNVRKFRQQNPTVNVAGGGSGELDRRADQIDDQLHALQADADVWAATCKSAEAALASPEAAVSYAATLRIKDLPGGGDEYLQARSDYTQGQRELERLQSRPGMRGATANPQLMGLQLDVAKLRDHLAETATAVTRAHLDETRALLQANQQHQAELTRSVAAVRKQVDEASVKTGDYMALDTQFKAKQAQRADLDAKVRNLRLAQETGGRYVTVVDPPRASPVPVWPIFSRSLAAGGVAGLVLGAASAILLASADDRIQSAETAVSEVGLPLLGVIPHIRRGKRRQQRMSAKARARAVHLEPSTDAAEAYRTIRTALYFGVASGKSRRGGPKRVLVTSALPGEGKSTFASNLAITMAQSGRRVVLVDADLRRPMQQTYQEMQTNPSTLADVFAGRVPLSTIVRRTGIDRLHLLACGLSAGATELLTAPLFGKMMESLHRAFDVVIIDSPPVLPVADARILAAGCDTTILVLRAGRSTGRVARQARDTLLSVGANLVGTVLNDAPRVAIGYGYAGLYGMAMTELPIGAATPNLNLTAAGPTAGPTVVKGSAESAPKPEATGSAAAVRSPRDPVAVPADG